MKFPACLIVACLCLLGGGAAAAQSAGERHLMHPDESAYQRFLEKQWDQLSRAEEIINGPAGARSLSQMNSQALALIRKTTGVMDTVHTALKETPVPDLFAAYRRNFMGFVNSLRVLIAGFEPTANSMDTALHEAFLKSRGDRYAFRSIAGGLAGKTIRHWLPLGRKQTHAVAFFRQRMTADAAAVNTALTARLEPGETEIPETASATGRTLTVSPYFLPVLVTTTDKGALLSIKRTLETPLGTVPVAAR